jgi:predicted nucleotidyltransferase
VNVIESERIDMSPSAQLLEEMVQRIVAAAAPRRIILFGSAARGQMHRDSDLDFLIVMPDGCDCLAVAQRVYRQMRGVNHPKDILVVQESDVEKHGGNPNLVISTALAEGKELYNVAS